MSRLFLSIIFSLFILLQTTVIAEEGYMEPLMVPEAASEEVNSDEEAEVLDTSEDQEALIEEVPTEIEENAEEETTPTSEEESNTESSEEEPQVEQEEEQTEEEPVVEAPSEDELEAQRAEEAELREVGAGEEPVIED